MKQYSLKVFPLTLFLIISLLSCDNEESDINPNENTPDLVEEDQQDTLNPSDCKSPKDLTIKVLEKDFFGDTVELNWTSGENEKEWEISYGGSLLSQARKFIVKDEPKATVTKVLDSEKAVFTITALCGEDSTSNPIQFPSLDGFTATRFAIMTAKINGQQFDTLQPSTIGLDGDASSVVTWLNHDGRHLQLQGGTRRGLSLSGVEINLYINEIHWKIGTFPLKGRREAETNEELNSFVEFFNLNEPNFYFSERTGEIKITKFDRDERILEGTFSFTYEKRNRDDDSLVATEKVENGTFKYSLDDDFFDKN